MRNGFTTGSCAAAAAKAAAIMLLFDTIKENISIMTPKGVSFETKVLDINRDEDSVSCAVKKDSGDDPDITNGMLIYARVRMKSSGENVFEGPVSGDISGCKPKDADDFPIEIDGGEGVGRVTKPGLDQPVGNAAINHVPRQMIEENVREVMESADFHGKITVTIFVPEGEKIAQKTFNPRLGIEGGISIIGTSGIVEPMSTKALIDTIRVELNQRRAMSYDYVAVAPGNYGRDYINKTYGYDIDRSVKCSNFIGDTIDIAAELGFKKLLLTGHIGKLIKVSGGMMNTHSSQGDCRMELLCAAALKEGLSRQAAVRILDCVVTEEALNIISEEGILDSVMCRVMDGIMYHLNKRAAGALQIECVMYSNDFGELAVSKGAREWLILLAREQEQRI